MALTAQTLINKRFIQAIKPVGGFQPTANMISHALLVIENPDRLEKTIAEELGIQQKNFSLWRHNPDYCRWYNSFFNDMASSRLLPNLYKALYNRAVVQDTAAAKILVERFDKDYKPQTSQTLQVDNFKPAENARQNSQERIKAIKAQIIENQTEFTETTEIQSTRMPHNQQSPEDPIHNTPPITDNKQETNQQQSKGKDQINRGEDQPAKDQEGEDEDPTKLNLDDKEQLAKCPCGISQSKEEGNNQETDNKPTAKQVQSIDKQGINHTQAIRIDTNNNNINDCK